MLLIIRFQVKRPVHINCFPSPQPTYGQFTICCSFNFDRIESGFNDVKDPDELFTFKKMVKHFKKTKVQYTENGQIKEVRSENV